MALSPMSSVGAANDTLHRQALQAHGFSKPRHSARTELRYLNDLAHRILRLNGPRHYLGAYTAPAKVQRSSCAQVPIAPRHVPHTVPRFRGQGSALCTSDQERFQLRPTRTLKSVQWIATS